MFELLLLRSFTIIIQQETEQYTPYFSEIPAQVLELQPPRFLRTNYRSPMPLELVQPPTARLGRDAGQIVADNDNGR